MQVAGLRALAGAGPATLQLLPGGCAMGAVIEPYRMPEQPSYEDYVDAWRQVDNRSAWFKARLAAAVPEGKLHQFAADVDVSYNTVKDYRTVAEKYPPDEVGTSLPSFGVAKALMAQDDRLELASREQPLTVREARKLVAERKGADPHKARQKFSDAGDVASEQGKQADPAKLSGPAAGEIGHREPSAAAAVPAGMPTPEVWTSKPPVDETKITTDSIAPPPAAETNGNGAEMPSRLVQVERHAAAICDLLKNAQADDPDRDAILAVCQRVVEAARRLQQVMPVNGQATAAPVPQWGRATVKELQGMRLGPAPWIGKLT